jgi:hypothetical protein
MRMRWLATAVLTAAILATAGPAAAGGSWLETEDQYYSPGSQATARGTFGPGAYEGRVSDGPYYAYLVPRFRWFEKPGPVPDYAIPLGPITIRRATGNYCCWAASLTFTVPDLPPGRYSIEYCNDPCTVNGIGDLIGGSFWVADTQEEARLMFRIERLEAKAKGLKRIKHDLRKAEAALAEAEDEQALLITNLRVAALQSASASARGEGAVSVRESLPAWVSGSLVAMALFLGGWYRRRLRQEIPDMVPDELVREVEAQVPSRQPMTSVGRPGMSIPAPPLTKS